MAKKSGAAIAVGIGAVALVGGGLAYAAKKKKDEAAKTEQKPPSVLPTVLTGYPIPPTPMVPQIVQPSTAGPDVQTRVTEAVKSGDPARMRALAQQLRAEGNTAAAASLESYAQAVEVGSNVVNAALATTNQILTGQTQTGAPGVPAPAPAPPPQAQRLPAPPPVAPAPASPPVTTPAGYQIPSLDQIAQTVQNVLNVPPPVAPVPVVPGVPTWPESNPTKYALALRMTNALRGRKAYQESNADKTLIKQYQAQEGLTQDGLYGAGTGTTVGQRYGIVPVKPLYWTKIVANVPKQKADWRAAMLALAIRDPSRATEWQAASNV